MIIGNPADASIAKYFQQKGYETEDGKLDAGKTTYFLRLIVGIVLGVGLFISILSFYILMLSIFLLLQKNTTKLENLLLIEASAGLPTSTIRRAGCASFSGAKLLLAHAIKDSGTNIVFNRLEKPTMLPLYCSVCPLPRRVISICTRLITPSESLGRLRLWAKPKLYRFK